MLAATIISLTLMTAPPLPERNPLREKTSEPIEVRLTKGSR